MRYFVYIFAKTKALDFHIGTTTDLKKTIAFHTVMGGLNMRFQEKTQLIYLEELPNQPSAEARFKEILALTKPAKIQLIEKVNPTYIELQPGVNIEI